MFVAVHSQVISTPVWYILVAAVVLFESSHSAYRNSLSFPYVCLLFLNYLKGTNNGYRESVYGGQYVSYSR